MTKSIMVPVDLAHKQALQKSIDIAGNLAKADKASLTLVGLTDSPPSEVAHNPKEYDEKLQEFAAEVSRNIGHPVSAQSIVDVDVPADLGVVLIKAAENMGADLIVMASHEPGILEYFLSSNAGYVASHAQCSVYVVR